MLPAHWGRLPYPLPTYLPLFTHVTSTRTRTLGICFFLRLFVWGHGIAWEEYLLLFSFFLSFFVDMGWDETSVRIWRSREGKKVGVADGMG
jgi:hypothetical protein